MKPRCVTTTKQLTATELLSAAVGCKRYLDMTVEDLMERLWESPNRPSIKPGRRYSITVEFHEINTTQEEE